MSTPGEPISVTAVPALPFSAITGQETVKLALILNAVDPKIGGVLIRGRPGMAKSTCARALANVLPQIHGVADCPFFCPPNQPAEMCPDCRDRLMRGEPFAVTRQPMRLVELPLNATEDRLVGGLDLERTLQTGRPQILAGLLARAHRSLLYIDEVNLLPDLLVDLLLDVAAMGVVTVEREGVSHTYPSRFLLVGTMNPDEGELRPQFLDRFGLYAVAERLTRIEDRVAVLEQQQAFERDPAGFRRAFEPDEHALRTRIRAARRLLPEVVVPAELRRAIARWVGIELQADGHRGDLVVHRAARALAALEGRREVTVEDVTRVAKLALPHRIRSKALDHVSEQLTVLVEDRAGESPDGPLELAQMEDMPEPAEDLDIDLPVGLAGVSRRIRGDGTVLSLNTVLRLPRDRTVHSDAGRRHQSPTLRRSGRSVRSRIQHPVTDLAFDATVRAAAPHQRPRGWTPGTRLILLPDDLRQKLRERKSKILLIFTLDASDSVMSRELMRAVKRAVDALLLDAYQKRDRVAMITFRFASGRVVLPPTANHTRARRCLDELWVGGPTPLAAGLVESLRLIEQQRHRDRRVYPVLILISDGLPNVDLQGGMRGDQPVRDALAAADRIAQAGIPSVVLDTGPNFTPRGRAYPATSPNQPADGLCRDLAQRMGAAYWVLAPLQANMVIERG
jgi:magnesium chelatase subunit D